MIKHREAFLIFLIKAMFVSKQVVRLIVPMDNLAVHGW